MPDEPDEWSFPDVSELVYSFCWPFPCIRQLFDQPGIPQVQHKLTLLTLGASGIRSCVTATSRLARQPLLSTARTSMPITGPAPSDLLGKQTSGYFSECGTRLKDLVSRNGSHNM